MNNTVRREEEKSKRKPPEMNSSGE
jgi:hypothetical protein